MFAAFCEGANPALAKRTCQLEIVFCRSNSADGDPAIDEQAQWHSIRGEIAGQACVFAN
jgi:hypothetical protein